jgi:hypothetical protein
VSTYPARLAEVRAALAAVPDEPTTWRQARREVRFGLLAGAVGTEAEDLPDGEARVLDWLADQDAETVAGVAALIDRARGGRP